jgi:hypothetical protein
MSTAQLQKEIINYLNTLPKEAVKEVLDFVQFLQTKTGSGKKNIHKQLSDVSESEIAHLENEFEDYKKLYPHE